MTDTPPDPIPTPVIVQAIIAYTATPIVWRNMNPRRWARLGWLVTLASRDDTETLDAIRGRHPAWADQADAASEEAARFAQSSPPGIHTELVDPDFAATCALRGQALRVITGVRGGSMTRCAHADITKPRPLYASAWGTRLQCRPCLIADPHPEEPTRAESRTCDMCGHRQRGPVMLATPTVGILTIGLGVCDACIRRMATLAGLETTGEDEHR